MERNTFLSGILSLVIISSTAGKKVDLAFLLDSWPVSNETGTADAESVKDLIQNIYGSFVIGDNALHVALLKSGTTATIEFDFNAYKDLDSLDEVVNDLTFPNSPSSMGKALDLANYGLFRNSGRPDAVKILMVLAKNKSTDDVNRAARDLRNSGVYILTVGIGQGLYRGDLQNIVSPPKQYNTLYGDFNSMEELAPSLVKRIKYIASTNVIRVPVTLEQTDKPNDHKQSEKCSKKCEKQVEGTENVAINCKNCKLGGCCDMCCKSDGNRPVYSGPIELTFVIDQSGELKNWNNFETMKKFIKNLTRDFDIADKKTKLGLISFTRDSVQIYDLRSYHDHTKIDGQIDKLNYEGDQTYSGPLDKAIDASQTNFFSESRDLSVPRVLLVFDGNTVKDDQTEAKAFKLQASDVQTFCIGLGINYDNKECDKIVEKPSKKHSMAAQVSQLEELREYIVRMVVNDISEKYCPFCGQGVTDACRPCKVARNYFGRNADEVLKIMKTSDKGSDQNYLKLTPELESSEKEEDEDDEEDVNNENGSQAKGKTAQDNVQIGTPLPNVDLVKDLLQTGTATVSYQNAQMPLMTINRPELQQNLAFPQQQPLQEQRIPSKAYPPLGITQSNVNQNLQLQNVLGSTYPSLDSQANIFSNGNANLGGPIDPSISVQPVVLSPSLLSQAILGTGKFQRGQKAKSKDGERKHISAGGPVAVSSELNLDSLPTFPTQEPSSTSFTDVASFQAGPLNPGITPSLPILPVPLRQQTEVQDSVPAQFQSLLSPALQLNARGPSQTTQHDRKGLFQDEYQYDQWDHQEPVSMGCKDLSDECISYATEGGCDEWAPLSPFGEVRRMCKKSCGLCDMNTEKSHKKSVAKQKIQRQEKPKQH